MTIENDNRLCPASAETISLTLREYQRLRENERMMMNLLGNLPGMVYRSRNDPDLTMEFVSEGSRPLIGYSPDALMSGTIPYASVILPEDRQRLWETVQAALAERASFEIIYRVETASGSRRWVWDRGRGVYAAGGQLGGIEGFITDVTERVQAFEFLEASVDERTRELRTLLEASAVIAATLDLDDLFERVFDQVRLIVDFTGATIVLREPTGFVRRASRYYGGRPLEPTGRIYPMTEDHPIEAALIRGNVAIIDDVLDDSSFAADWRSHVGDDLERAVQYARSWMAVPMRANEQVVGFISMTHKEPRHYTHHHAELLAAITNHVATAVENARLHGQARRLAAVEERQRLARELHDSVSQALYGISLGAQTARALLDRDPSDLRPPLDYILELADAGLAEMRALIFELRPESLETEGLVVALQKRVSAVRARHRLSVDLTTCDEPEWLSLDAKEALYRIAQESIHNTVKHAGATWIGVRLSATPETVILEVVDDGRGFDAGGSFPGHLGLVSMRERIVRLAGSLSIESAPGAGTSVRAELRRQAE